eukprot:jgi/Mesvir1/27893/Mv22797-RA.1
MMTLHQVAELIVKNACAPDGATQPEEIPSAKALIKWMQENLFEGKGKERKCKLLTVTEKDAKTLIKMLKEHDARRDKSPKIAKGSKKAAEAAAVEGNEYVQAERATHAAILYSISLDQHPRRENMKIDSTWTAAVDEHQKGLSEALATYKGKALKGKGKGKEVEVADAPVSLLEKWEKSPVSQDDDDILDLRNELAPSQPFFLEVAKIVPADAILDPSSGAAANIDPTDRWVLVGYWVYRDKELPHEVATLLRWPETTITLVASDHKAAVPITSVTDVVSVLPFWEVGRDELFADYAIEVCETCVMP